MTTDQLRAAAEGIMLAYTVLPPDEPLDMASHKVARWALPLLDRTRIDGKWLESVGAIRHESHPSKWAFRRDDALDIGLWLVDDGWKAMLLHSESAASCIIRGVETRGDLRTLARALGITLKE